MINSRKAEPSIGRSALFLGVVRLAIAGCTDSGDQNVAVRTDNQQQVERQYPVPPADERVMLMAVEYVARNRAHSGQIFVFRHSSDNEVELQLSPSAIDSIKAHGFGVVSAFSPPVIGDGDSVVALDSVRSVPEGGSFMLFGTMFEWDAYPTGSRYTQ